MSALARLSPVTAEGVRILTLDRAAKSNALSAELVDDLHGCLDVVCSETRVLAITGDGRNFCSGFDMTDVASQSEGDLLLRFVRINHLLDRLRLSPYVTLAWVTGAAFGAGADIVCACSVRIGSGAVKLRFPGFQFGVALGTRRLAALVGYDRARRLLMHNETFGTEGALACGLLNESAGEALLDVRAQELALTVARLDTQSLQTLWRLTDDDSGVADLADLVASVARPGLHERIAAYRAQ